MPRQPRVDEAGGIYHALNRGNARQTIFRKPGDYQAFLETLGEGLARYPVRLYAFCLMPNHWHLVVSRYVERNAVRAGLLSRAESWKYGSLWRWLQRPEAKPQVLSSWPIRRSPDWLGRVNEPLTDRELKAVRCSVERGRPFGAEDWTESIANRLGLWSTLRPRGRPRKKPPK